MSDDLGDKISHLERVKAVLHKHFAYEIDAVIQKAIQKAAAELLAIIPSEYLKQLEEKSAIKENTPRGVKIPADEVIPGHQYTFVLTNWIADKKQLPTQFTTKDIEDITTKALLIKYQGKEIWVPKSQIVAVYLEDKEGV